MEKKQTTLRQEPELNAKLKVIAERKGYSVSDLIMIALWNYIDYQALLL